MIGSERAMKTEQQEPAIRWPFDLRVFAIMAGLWAICLVIRAFVHPLEYAVVDPIQVVLGGVRFDGDAAPHRADRRGPASSRPLQSEFSRSKRWGLLLALCSMAEIVMSHLAFVIAYLPVRSEWMTVRATAMEGPMMVLITLYLWIRATDLIFDAPASPVRARRVSGAQHQEAISADSAVLGK